MGLLQIESSQLLELAYADLLVGVPPLTEPSSPNKNFHIKA